MSKKIQVVIDDPIAEEVDAIVAAKRFGTQSEFVRHLIREYLNQVHPVKEITPRLGDEPRMPDIVGIMGYNQQAPV